MDIYVLLYTKTFGKDIDGRLNVVFSLVSEFAESSHVTNPFWSRDKANRRIHHFYELDFSADDAHGISPFY